MRSQRLKRSGVLDDMVDRQKTDFAMHTGSNVLVYLVHGVTGTPAEMHYIGKELARHGWDIYATTLPGHCTRLRDLVKTSERDWCGHVERQLACVRDRYDYVFIAGLSAGALLALDASTNVHVDGIGVLSPTFVYDGWNTPWSHAILPLAMKVVPLPLQHLLFHIDGPPFGIKDDVVQARVRAAYRPLVILREVVSDWWTYRTWSNKSGNGTGALVPSAASMGYPIFPLRTLTEIDRLITRVRPLLRWVTAPTLILQAQEDDMTSPRNAFIVHDEIASSEKRLVLLDDCYHVITVDKQKHAVVSQLIDFFANDVLDRQFVPRDSFRHQSAAT